MSSLLYTPLNAGVTGYAVTAFGAGNQIARALGEKITTVQFVRAGAVLVSFDAVVQETHGIDAQPTMFPVEDGSNISDHVIRQPREISLQGIVTDTPLRDKKLLQQEVINSAAGFVLGAAGVVGVGATQAYQAYASSQALAESVSPSIASFRQIVSMATGDNGQPPVPFTVRTAITEYPNMIIRSVQVPRDVTTGAALVFGITLTSMLIVASSTITAVQSAVPMQAFSRSKKGEEQANKVAEAYKAGRNDNDILFGQKPTYTDVASVQTGR